MKKTQMNPLLCEPSHSSRDASKSPNPSLLKTTYLNSVMFGPRPLQLTPQCDLVRVM